MVSLVSAPAPISDHRAVLGEGPLWDPRDRRLYWLDIKGGLILSYSPETGETETYDAPGMVSALGLAQGGGFICVRRDGFARLTLDSGKAVFDTITDPEADLPGNRFNDGKVDPAGGFWAGTMDDAEEETRGAWWRLSPEGHTTRLADGYMVTNGPAFDPAHRKVYLTDSARQTVRVAESDGLELGAAQTFVQFKEGDGYPDGMTVDREGCVWIAFWDGWAIRRFSPEGDCLLEIDMPVARPTSLTLVGARVYVTSASIGLSDKALARQPHAGASLVLILDQPLEAEHSFVFAG